MLRGLSPRQKHAWLRALYREIVSGLAAAAEDVSIVLHEPPMENWGVRGGVPASEVDVGFRVDI